MVRQNLRSNRKSKAIQTKSQKGAYTYTLTDKIHKEAHTYIYNHKKRYRKYIYIYIYMYVASGL